jgi:HEAT repeat protein
MGRAGCAAPVEAVRALLGGVDADILARRLHAPDHRFDQHVRRLVVDGLREWKRPEVVEAVLAALADADENVRDQAWASLKALTGQKIPFEAAGPKDARSRAAQRWLDWWEKNKATFGG